MSAPSRIQNDGRPVDTVFSKSRMSFQRATVKRGWAGLFPGTPDRHPIIDRLADGLYAALGFSGTGLMHSPPAAGLLIAELVLGGAITSIDPGPLAAGRFTADQIQREVTGF